MGNFWDNPRWYGLWSVFVPAMLACIALVVAAKPASAQEDRETEAFDDPFAATVIDPVQLNIRRVGVGNRARAGDWAGILVQIQDQRGGLASEAVLRISGFDRDGDTPYFDRELTLNAGELQSAWLYARMPYIGSGVDRLIVTAHEATEGVATDGALTLRPGDVIGRAEIGLSQLLEPTRPLIGVIGFNHFGLAGYGLEISGRGYSPRQHSRAEIATQLGAADLPDRWQGLSPFNVLVWGPGEAETDPLSALDIEEKADAIEGWIRRGGHLVVILPVLGQSWFTPQNPLYEILPAMSAPTRREAADLEPYRPLLTSSTSVPLRSDAIIQELNPRPDAAVGEADPILVGPDGEVLALQRIVGSGAVTVIGLDLQDASLRRNNLPDAETFWHRILGKRGRIQTWNDLQGEDPAAQADRRRAFLDGGIESAIDQSRTAAVGVLLGLAVFVVYWLVAGPGGYALLSKFNQKRHAWIVFGAAVAVFTLLAWSGAAIIRPRAERAEHIAIIEEIAGQNTQRARVWASVLAPFYGTAQLSVANEDDNTFASDTTGGNLITPWEPPDVTESLIAGFPDNRGYRLDARRPDTMSAPARQTIKQVRLDWAGEPRWSLPRVIGEPGDLEEPTLRLAPLEERGTGTDTPLVTGEIIHDLPQDLTRVWVIVVEGQQSIPNAGASALRSRPLARGRTYAIDRWAPGVRLDLAELTASNDPSSWRPLLSVLERFRNSGRDDSLASASREDPIDSLYAASLYDQVEPPPIKGTGTFQIGGPRIINQRETHRWSLGRWFSRPCVIVMGLIEQTEPGESPVPLRLNGEEIPSVGSTVVRWVYPLAAEPPAWQSNIEAEEAAKQEAAASESESSDPGSP